MQHKLIQIIVITSDNTVPTQRIVSVRVGSISQIINLNRINGVAR